MCGTPQRSRRTWCDDHEAEDLTVLSGHVGDADVMTELILSGESVEEAVEVFVSG